MSEDTMAADVELDAEAEARVDVETAAEAAHEAEHQGDNAEPEGEQFSRSYVDKLRKENATHRERATKAAEETDRLARALYAERVAALGLLADPTDLPFDAERLDNAEAIREAAETLLAAKPHLRTRRITARVGQGESPADDGVSLASMLRQRA